MFWLLLVAISLILGRTYVWSILLWCYGRAGINEQVDLAEPFFDASPAPAVPATPPFLRPPVPPRPTHLRPAA